MWCQNCHATTETNHVLLDMVRCLYADGGLAAAGLCGVRFRLDLVDARLLSADGILHVYGSPAFADAWHQHANENSMVERISVLAALSIQAI